MASNKNQHFVPRCYLRPFTVNSGGSAINLYNIDRQKFIERAPVKHQCSGDYFYGDDPQLEKAIQSLEGAYGATHRTIHMSGFVLSDAHRNILRLFWLLQYLRTEAASKRSVEMSAETEDVIGINDPSYRLQIRDAVQMAMMTFAKSMHIIDDLKICLLRNKTRTPFITSDDPAVLTNRWYLDSAKAKGRSFGLNSGGNILLLPLSPVTLCLGYDGDVYSIPHKNGWVEIRRDSDVEAFNQHQFLNCRANVFVQDSIHSQLVHGSYQLVAPYRLEKRHHINYAVLDRSDTNHDIYRVVDRAEAVEHNDALIHSQVMHAKPPGWPSQITWREKGFVFTNDTGLGFIRRASTNRETIKPFRKEYIKR